MCCFECCIMMFVLRDVGVGCDVGSDFCVNNILTNANRESGCVDKVSTSFGVIEKFLQIFFLVEEILFNIV